MEEPDLTQVSKKIINLMDSINEILKIVSSNTSNLLSSLGMLNLKHLLENKSSSYQMTVENVSDAYLNSIGCK